VSFSPYQSYKQPEVPWLAALPHHWEIRRTKTMLRLQKSQVGRSASDFTLLSLTLGGVIRRNIAEGGKFPAEFDTYQVVEPNDLVFCLFDIDETPRTIGIARDFGMITGAYSVYRTLGPCIPEYACYYFLHLDSFKGLRPFYTGLRKVVRADTFSKVEIPSPPLAEQTQITRFLDYETARIDALIEKQQQLIALLKEKRQGVISQAVTKGLNPNAPLRDSGVEWLGMVPAHWEVSRLRHVAAPGTSITYGIVQAGPHVEGGVPYIKTSDMAGTALPKDGYQRTSHAIDRSYARSRVYPGDLVISIRASVGKCLPVPDELSVANLTQGTAKISPGEKVDREFLLAFLSSPAVQDFLMSMAKGATFKEITLDMLRRVPVLIPPKEEQVRIAANVGALTARFDRLADMAAIQSQLLQERRTALISAAVTGRIDVRGWAPPESNVEQDVA
jgi:type I restriction enzyme, S subunit